MSIEAKNRGWLVLVRAAELVARSGLTVQVDRLSGTIVNSSAGRTAMQGWRFTISTSDDLDIDAPTEGDETVQLAELTANRWFERMKSAERSVPPPENECETCGAVGGQDCKPMHDGERDPGGWSHPLRLLDHEGGESAVVQWARRVKARKHARIVHEDCEALPGVPLAGSWMEERADDGMYPELVEGIDRIADELITLAYINGCALLTTRRQALEQRCPEITPTDAMGDGTRSFRCQHQVGHAGLHRAEERPMVPGEERRVVEWRGQPIRRRRPNNMGNEIIDAISAAGAPTIELRTGPPPLLISDPRTGDLLASMSVDGSGAAWGVAVTSGDAGHFRVFDASDQTCHIQGTCSGVGDGGDLQLDNARLIIGQQIEVMLAFPAISPARPLPTSIPGGGRPRSG